MPDINVEDITGQLEGVRAENVPISNCDKSWDNASPEIEVSLDTDEFQEGGSSIKIEIPANYTGLLATTPLDNMELDMIDQLKIRIKSTAPLGTGVLKLLLSENPKCINPLENLNLQGISENIWELHKLTVTNPKDLLEIMSCGLELTQPQSKSFTLYVDIVKGYNSDYNIKSSQIHKHILDALRQVAGYLDLPSISKLDLENDIIRGAIILWAGGQVWNYIYDETSQDREGFNRGPYLIRQAREMLKQFLGEEEDGDKVMIPTSAYRIDSEYGGGTGS